MLKTRHFRSLIGTFGLLAGLGLLSRDALACGGEWGPFMMEPDHRPRAIPLAEKALESGKTVAAAGIVLRVIPHIGTLAPTSAPIVERAHRVLSVALARHRGALPVEREVPDYARGSWTGKDDKARAHNLKWAVNSMRALHASKKDDTAIETDLAEVLARVPEHQQEARMRLERLAERDLVASAEGYAALAELRAASGDADGQKVALGRCRAMSKSKELCPAAAESAS